MNSADHNPLRPRGVALDEIAEGAETLGFAGRRQGAGLILTRDEFTTRVDVVAPAAHDAERFPIRAVVQIRTEIPESWRGGFADPVARGQANACATLGAVTVEDGRLFVGSRLTIFQAEDAWKLHLPLLLAAIDHGATSILKALQSDPPDPDEPGKPSAWTSEDLWSVKLLLGQRSVATCGDTWVNAEFGLRKGARTVFALDLETALLQMTSGTPHRAVGQGLRCVLDMPHVIGDEERVDKILHQLNRMEMAAHDMPPHFGAWCRGRLGTNPAYLCFLPESLHAVPGIARNVAMWAAHRAYLADASLAGMGVGVDG